MGVPRHYAFLAARHTLVFSTRCCRSNLSFTIYFRDGGMIHRVMPCSKPSSIGQAMGLEAMPRWLHRLVSSSLHYRPENIASRSLRRTSSVLSKRSPSSAASNTARTCSDAKQSIGSQHLCLIPVCALARAKALYVYCCRAWTDPHWPCSHCRPGCWPPNVRQSASIFCSFLEVQ